MGLNGWELGIILVLVLIVFGAGKLPDVFRQAGKGIKAFKDASEGKGKDGEEEDASDETEEEREERLRRRKEQRKLAAKDDLDDDPEEARTASSAKKERR